MSLELSWYGSQLDYRAFFAAWELQSSSDEASWLPPVYSALLRPGSGLGTIVDSYLPILEAALWV